MAIWYPSLKAFDDLMIVETEDGLEFSAPDGTECAAWLGYYNSTEELREEFNADINGVLTEHIERLESGSSQQNTQRIQEDREQAEIN
jgi:hypothetical protein